MTTKKQEQYNKWKAKFDKDYKEFNEYIVKKVQFMTKKEFEKFKNRQINRAIKMGIFIK